MSKLDNLQQINTNVPRETLVFATDELVIKRPLAKKSPMDKIIWLEKQRHARNVSDKLVKIANKEYFVPTTLEISTNEFFSVEEKVKGRPITSSYFEALNEKDIDIVYNGLAHFINDINQAYPVLTQKDLFEMESGAKDLENMKFNDILEKLGEHLTPEQLKTVKEIKSWFDKASETDASVVFSHGDMNEHNIFYDTKTNQVSVIDFADAKYETIYQMFHRNFARLGWLNIERLIEEYQALPRKQPVNMKNNNEVTKIKNRLYEFKTTALELINAPKKSVPGHLKNLKESFKDLSKTYNAIKVKEAKEIMEAKLSFNSAEKKIEGKGTQHNR